jgi:hypothetical protein
VRAPYSRSAAIGRDNVVRSKRSAARRPRTLHKALLVRFRER